MDAKCGMKCGGQLWARVAKIILFFPFLLAFVVGGLGFEFCVFVAGWRHALRSEWPFIIFKRKPIWRGCPVEVAAIMSCSLQSRQRPHPHPSNLDGYSLRQDWSANIYYFSLTMITSQKVKYHNPTCHNNT